MLKNQDSRHEGESQFQYWEMKNVKVQDNSKKEGNDERAAVSINVQQSRGESTQ